MAFQYSDDHLLTNAGSLRLGYLHQSGLPYTTTLGIVSDEQEYSPFGERVRYTAAASGADVFDVQYTYDSLARISTLVETVGGATGVYSYTYDNRDRLTGVYRDGSPISDYTYDPNGNRLSSTGAGGTTLTATYDDQDRLLTYGNNVYTYTANGELLSKTIFTQTTTYDYDVMGSLRGVTLPDGTQIEYVVDGEDRRVGKRVDGILMQGFL